MMRIGLKLGCVLAVVGGVGGLGGSRVHADEGMWTYNHFPKALVKQRYGFEVTDAWLEHLRLASVRFNSGGSGSFVSEGGLVMTNHHVGADCIQKLGATDHDYVRDGFLARSAAEEIKCPDLELNVLVAIEDVTSRVRAAEKPGMDEATLLKAQKEKMAALEQACAEQSKDRCDVVTLYQGGMYNLYRYKKYTDVRLVFAPEFQIAFFGGDPDNFEYPRYDLDVAFFRAYEADKAVRPARWLGWSESGARDGELVFTSGNPGNTERLDTVAQLELLRDVAYPTVLRDLERGRKALQAYSARGPDQARQARTPLFGHDNAIKAITGYHRGLLDQALMAQKLADEEALRKEVAASPERQKRYGGVWAAIDTAQKAYASFYKRYLFGEGRASRLLTGYNVLNSRLFGIARTLLRTAEERGKPNAKRLAEYRESSLPSVELALFSTAPIHPGLEEAMLASALERLKAELGPKDPLVRAALAGASPAERAATLVSGTQLGDPAVRRRLYQGGKKALAASKDPMIALARALEPEARALRKRHEDEVESVVRRNLGLLGRAQYEARGLETYPDATFTLRLSFGKVSGYPEGTRQVPPMTTFGGLFVRSRKAGGKPPWELPKSWVEAKSRLRPVTPMNFVSTNDIIGGNSGSPVVNRQGRVVGLIFDGNVHSLANNFVYRAEQDRAVSVHSVAIMEALRKIYGAGALADELQGRKPGAREK